MKKLFFILIVLCGYAPLDAMMNTRSKSKKTKKGTVPSRRKKRKISPTAFTESEEKEKKTTSEKEQNKKEKGDESDSEKEDEVKVNLPLAQFLHQLSETDGEESMNAIAMMKDKHLSKFMAIKEKELALKTKLVTAALQRMQKDTKHGMTIALGDLVIKTNTHNDPPEMMFS